MSTLRRFVLFAIALMALSGAIVAATATANLRDYELRGYVDPTQNTELPFRIPLPRFGVNAELTQYDSVTLHRELERMQGTGVTWVRQFARWDEIEITPGEYDWSEWDRITAAVQDYPNLRLVVVLVNTPGWARDERSPGNPTTPPTNPNDFAKLATAFAMRYGTSIDYYQVWDEPNLEDNWGGLPPRPTDYAAMLAAGYRAIHSADASATVIAAALAPTTENNDRNVSDIVYLNDLYTLGLSEFSDAVAAKPYGFDFAPDDRTVHPDVLNFSRIVALREVMVAQGDGQTALWASHWGWNSFPADSSGNPSIWGSVNQEEQIRYTLGALTRAEREWPWLGGMILHHWQPSAPLDDPQWGFALVRPDGMPTPMLEALAARAPQRLARNGLYPPDNPFSEYSGLWTFGSLGADIGWQDDSMFAFEFYGRDVSLRLRQGDYVAYLYPRLDGYQLNTVPSDASGNPYIVLTSGDRLPTITSVTVARELPLDLHTLRVTADRGEDQWALVGLAVSDGDLASGYNAQINVAWFVAFVTGLAVIVTGYSVLWRTVLSPISRVFTGLSTSVQIGISIVTSLSLMLGMLLTWQDAIPTIFRREPVYLGLSLVTAGVIYLNPGVILTVAATVVLFSLVYHRITTGLILILLFAPFFLFPVELYVFAFPMVELLTILTFAGWCLRQLVEWGEMRRIGATRYPPTALRVQGLDWCMIGYVIVGLVAITWSEYTSRAVTEFRTLFLEPALFYLILRTVITTERQKLQLFAALLTAGFLVSVIGLILYIQGDAIITAEAGARRLASVYGSPNNVALFLGRCIPIALVLALTTILKRHQRVLVISALGVMLAALALTQSVGGLFIGVPAAVISVLLLLYRQRAVMPVMGIVVITILVFGALSSQSERFARALDFTQGTNFIRLRVWESAINVIEDHPVTGIGLDQFLYAFRDTYILPDAEQESDLSHPHNWLLDFWTRLGVLGVGLFITIQAIFWRTIWTVFQNKEANRWTIIIAIALSGIMANTLAHGLIDNSVFVLDLVYVFVFALALNVGLRSNQPQLIGTTK